MHTPDWSQTPLGFEADSRKNQDLKMGKAVVYPAAAVILLIAILALLAVSLVPVLNDLLIW